MSRTSVLALTLAIIPVSVTFAHPGTGASTQPVGDRRAEVTDVEQRVPAALANRHAAPDAGIDAANAASLTHAWTFETDDPVTHAALVDGGDLFFADWDGNVHKLDAATGEVHWTKAVHESEKDWPWHGFAGSGVLVGALYVVAAVEGDVYGIERDTGDVRWQASVTDDPEGGSLATLLAHDGLVFVGLQSVEEMLSQQEGFEVNFQGGVVALDAATGEQVWELPLVEPPQTGVSVWSGFSLDPELGLLYFTTGNTYTGDEAAPLGDAIVAVNATTGDVQWARQTFAHDVWLPGKPIGPDYDFSGAPQLVDVMIDGRRRGLVLAAQKSGLLWAFDRETGERAWSTTVGYGGVAGGMMGDASIGGGLVFAWSNNGYTQKTPPHESPLTVKQLDAATGRPIWTVDAAQPAAEFAAGLLTGGADGGVYFVGSLDGTIAGYDAGTGKTLVTLEDQPNVGGSLTAANGMLYAPAAKPDIFPWMKSDHPNGIYAYRATE